MNLHVVGKLRCGITTLNTRLTRGTETENKGEKLGVDYQKKGEGNKPEHKAYILQSHYNHSLSVNATIMVS